MQIGFLGVGSMGQPMAGRLIDAGHELWIHDVREEAMTPLLERQARRTDSPKELGDSCEIVAVSLPTLGIFRGAVTGPDGLLSGKRLKTIINTCTVGGPFVEEIAQACAAKGIVLIDAPISGGPPAAAAGTLAVMVSGDPAQIEKLRPIFQAWGSKLVIAGDKPGAAQIMKLTNNILFAVSLIATSEAMVMAERGGLSPEAMIDLLNNGTGRNFSTMTLFPQAVLPRTFAFGATFDIIMKDVNLAIEQGDKLGIPMWVCQAAQQVLKQGIYQGRGKQDLSRAIQIIEQGAQKQ